jgi:hypothetical protein
MYDWQTEGGRWSKFYKNKKGKFVTDFTLKEIDWDKTKRAKYKIRKESGYYLTSNKGREKWQDMSIAPAILIINNYIHEIDDDDEEFFKLLEGLDPSTRFLVYDFHC